MIAPSLFLAAAYAFGLVQNHPFVDGNKRTAFVACAVFLSINGLELRADTSDATQAMLSLAASEMTEEEFAEWLAQYAV